MAQLVGMADVVASYTLRQELPWKSRCFRWMPSQIDRLRVIPPLSAFFLRTETQAVASEMNLSETAFLRKQEGGYRLRWFTPKIEVDLCGHATLASAHVLWGEGQIPPEREIHFHTNSEEELMDIHDKALYAGLEVHLISDSGKTEFHGEPTRTCIAIGPDEADKIDEITLVLATERGATPDDVERLRRERDRMYAELMAAWSCVIDGAEEVLRRMPKS